MLVGIRFMAAVLAAVVVSAMFAAPALADDVTEEQVKKWAMEAVEDSYKKNHLETYYKNTRRYETADKKFTIKAGGRIMLDYSSYFSDDFDDAGVDPDDYADGFEFRRVRLYTEGLVYDHVGFKLQLDFAAASDDDDDDDVVFKDVYISLLNLGDCFGCAFADILIGHFKQPVSLEELTSSKYITFMERSAIEAAFVPSRKTGIMAARRDLRGGSLGWYASFYSPSVGNAGQGLWEDGYAVAGRIYWAPWFPCDCPCQRLHLGISGHYDWSLDGKRWRARPPTHLTDRFVTTGTVDDVDEWWMLGFELAFVYGPWSFQAEYMLAEAESDTFDDPSFDGWYAYVSYWLTGECRAYSNGTFGRVKPCCNFLDNDCCCTGGWELKLRYETLDLSEADGGEQWSWTFGVNWHLNPNTRFMFEYFLTTVDGVSQYDDGFTFNEDEISGLQCRFQIDF